MTAPRATLRLQFHKDFTFSEALAHVDYFAALGVSHIYGSPILKARPGSVHGYDVVDHSEVNPELGGEAGLRLFVAALRHRDMGFIADIVPNHMCVSDSGNRWWSDILEWGPESRHAGFFDIDWHSRDPALRNKVHMPFLGKPYGEALADGELSLRMEDGRFHVRYFDHRFPLAPQTYGAVLLAAGDPTLNAFAETLENIGRDADMAAEARARLVRECENGDIRTSLHRAFSAFDPRTPDGRKNLHQLLERQNYRLAWWRTAADEINWRRFFDISDLAGLRVEDPDVFEATHELIFKLYGEGVIDGLRVDHIDGLADPRAYCRRLRRRLDTLIRTRPDYKQGDRPWIVIEKILASNERVPGDWQVDGTTGYDFMNEVSGVLHDPRGEAPLTTLWTDLTERRADFRAVALDARRLILDENLHSERDKTAMALHRLARVDPATRDYTLPALRNALTEVLLRFPVYRSYTTLAGRAAGDAALFETALGGARAVLPESDAHILELIDAWLGGTIETDRARRVLQRRAIASFQQLTSALTAKAVEDTAFYRYGRLISRNEVGSSPAEFAYERDQFHAACIERQRHFPLAMVATATHDHKRGEDARMRIATLGEMPDVWAETVRGWMRLNAPFRAALADGVAPEPGDEIMLYETLIGAWPNEADPTDESWLASFRERILGWLTKSVREAKRRSRWIAPDEAYEDAARAFAADILDNARSGAFLAELGRFVRAIAPAAAVNGLTQTFLRMTTPGMPDLYQGTEFWDLSLVDPDNRRPVDFVARAAALAEDAGMDALLADWQSGKVKQALVARLLAMRALHPALFATGSYQPLVLEGQAALHAVAFARLDGGGAALALATRFPVQALAGADKPLAPESHWEEARVFVPGDLSTGAYTDALTGRKFDATSGSLPLRDVFSALPVALLLRD